MTYIGHATTLIRLGDTSILTDPLLRGSIGPLRWHGPKPPAGAGDGADVVLISHLHRDHLDLGSLRRVSPQAAVVAPRGARRWVERSGLSQIREVGPGETISLEGIEVTAVTASHDGHRDRFGATIEPLGYLITRHGTNVYFAGDTDLFPEMAEIAPVDLALVPIAGWGPTVGPGHLDPRRAAEALRLLRPRIVVPIHWGTLYPIGLRRLRPGPLSEPAREFARHAAELAPDVEVRILEPGATTELETA